MIGGVSRSAREPRRYGARPTGMRALLPVMAGLLVAVSMSLVPAARAFACSCVGFTERQAFDAADVVFEGVVRSASPPFILESSGEPVDYTFAVEKRLKGAGSAEDLEVSSALGEASCGVEFLVGERWRVFARSDGHGLQTNLCAGNRLLDKASPETAGPSGGSGPGEAMPGGLPGVGLVAALLLLVMLLFSSRLRA